MSNPGFEILNSHIARAGDHFSQRCLLCGAPSRTSPVCGPCEAELPRLTGAQCCQCATPLPLADGALCGACLASPPWFDRLISPFVYRFPIDALIQALKYGGRLAVARFLASAMMRLIDEAFDVIIPMPLSEARLRERGFNQAQELARHIGRRSGIAVVPSLCRRVRETPPQTALPWKARAANVRGAFVADSVASGLRIAVIDDVTTTGATLNEASRVLKQAGATRVVGLSAARALKQAGKPHRLRGEFGADLQTPGL